MDQISRNFRVGNLQQFSNNSVHPEIGMLSSIQFFLNQSSFLDHLGQPKNFLILIKDYIETNPIFLS